MKSWYTISNLADDTAEVCIYDQIGNYGVSARQFCTDLSAIKAAKINVRINSPGGSVFDAAAICTAIREHSAEVTAHVDGLAASAASVVAAACDQVTMGKSAFMMIHCASTYTLDNAAGMRKQADTLEKMDGTIAQGYADKSKKKSKDEFLTAMTEETWFDATDAKAWGLCDTVKDEEEEDEGDEDGQENLNHLSADVFNQLKYKNVPDRVRLMLAENARAQLRGTAMDPIKVINRDGKSFVLVNGKELEIEGAGTAQASAGAGAPTNVAKPTDEARAKAELDAAVTAAKNQAVTEERAYRGMFATVAASASLVGEDLAKFEKDFYGRAEADLKFLASHAIGQRAKPVGEGSGKPENQGEDKDAETKKYCAKKFAADPTLRRRFRVNTIDANDAGYKAGLERFVQVELKCRADEAMPARREKQDEEASGNDPITKILSNKSVVEYV